MPTENAFELIPRVKKLRPDLPIIVMSAQNTFMTAITAAERGAYESLPKPFDLNELIAVVRDALWPSPGVKTPQPLQPSRDEEHAADRTLAGDAGHLPRPLPA